MTDEPERNAYRVIVEIPLVEQDKVYELMDAICKAVDDWTTQFPDRNWDEFMHGHSYYDDIYPPAGEAYG